MRRTAKSKVLITVITVMMVVILTACASKMESDKSNVAYDSGSAPEAPRDYDMKDEEELTSQSAFTLGNSPVSNMEKIIKYVNLDVETQEFDVLIETIKDEITQLGGYDERTEISGNSYNSYYGNRRANIIARIPKDKLDKFVSIVSDNANVINENSSSENVTLEYVDTESRKKSLQIEQDRLFELLEKTDTLDDIITLESRLSAIRHELQMYETQLRTMDNKVDYSTVTISISEVARMTPTQEKETVFTRIKNGFSDTIYDISEGLKNFVVWFVVNLPYLIIWAIVIIVAVVISRKIYKKQENKKGVNRIQENKDSPIQTVVEKINKEEVEK
jgi:hypothetical protein